MDHPSFDYDKLLTHLGHLGAEKVTDSIYGNRVDIPTDYGRAISICPGDEGDPLYQVNISTWDRTGAGGDVLVDEAEDVLRAIDIVREAYVDEEKRLEREDALWASLEEPHV